MFQGKRRKKRSTARRVEIQPAIWLPEASRFGNLLESNGIRYAIFGAGALAVHKVMIRPTIDIDFVVDDYRNATALLRDQPGMAGKNLKKEKDGIQVADFYFQSGVTVQIWDNNLYSLPMNADSWMRLGGRAVPGYGLIQAISMEDLIASKVGRYTQQRAEGQYEAEKNVRDIVSAMAALPKPDYKYVIKMLKEGARRETSSNSSTIHSLDWYFVREIQVYRSVAESSGFLDRVSAFTTRVLVEARTPPIEYRLLHSLGKKNSLKRFQSDFMLDDKSLALLLKRWEPILQIDADRVVTSSKSIQKYIETLGPERLSEYAKRMVYSGKNAAGQRTKGRSAGQGI